MDRILPLIVIAAGALFLFGKNSVSNVLSKMVVSFRTVRPDIVNARLILIFDFYNPLPTSISLDSIIGNVTINGKPIFDFYNNNPQLIQPGNNLIEIYTLPTPQGVNNLINQIQNARVSTSYTLVSGPISYQGKSDLM